MIAYFGALRVLHTLIWLEWLYTGTAQNPFLSELLLISRRLSSRCPILPQKRRYNVVRNPGAYRELYSVYIRRIMRRVSGQNPETSHVTRSPNKHCRIDCQFDSEVLFFGCQWQSRHVSNPVVQRWTVIMDRLWGNKDLPNRNCKRKSQWINQPTISTPAMY